MHAHFPPEVSPCPKIKASRHDFVSNFWHELFCPHLSKQSIPALEETAGEEGADEEDTKEQGAPVTNLVERTDE